MDSPASTAAPPPPFDKAFRAAGRIDAVISGGAPPFSFEPLGAHTWPIFVHLPKTSSTRCVHNVENYRNWRLAAEWHRKSSLLLSAPLPHDRPAGNCCTASKSCRQSCPHRRHMCTENRRAQRNSSWPHSSYRRRKTPFPVRTRKVFLS